MKKIVKFVILTFLFLIASCNNADRNEVSVPEEIPVEYQDLFTKLGDYNASLGLNLAPASRSRFLRFLRNTVCADVVGFGVGLFMGGGVGSGLFYGIFSSAINAPGIILETIQVNDSRNLVTRADMPSEKIPLDNIEDIGIIHNQILLEMYEEDSLFLSNLSDEELFVNIKERLLLHYPDILDELNQESTLGLYDVITGMEGDDEEAMFRKMIDLMPRRANDVEVIRYYIETIARSYDLSDEEISEITDGFQRIVNESDLSQDSKDLINSSVSVAENSKALWDSQSD